MTTDAPTLWGEAVAARDEAMLRVQANSTVWRTIAWDVLRELAAKRELLTSDDLTEEMDRRGHVRPGDARAVGPVMQRAIREHLLTPVGFVKGRNPRHHLDWARQYRSVR
jgi:hypothetical protein